MDSTAFKTPVTRGKKERKKGITPQSAKAKGRHLQQAVRDIVLDAFPELTLEDVRSTSMGCGGVDLQLSTVAGNLFPFCVECKNVETLQLWKCLEQAEINTTQFNEIRSPMSRERHALLVFKKNGREMFACLRLNVVAEALKSSVAADLNLMTPRHYQETANIWAKIDDAVAKGLETLSTSSKPKKPVTTRSKEIMNSFTCTAARKGTPTYAILSLKAFMALLPTITQRLSGTDVKDGKDVQDTCDGDAVSDAVVGDQSFTFAIVDPIVID